MKPETNWKSAFSIYLNRSVLAMLFLGFAAGLPLFLIFSTLSIWLREAGVDRAEVTFFSWAALGYSFKFIWSPLIDKLPIPVLNRILGHRRSWLLLTQLCIVLSICWMALIDPSLDSSIDQAHQAGMNSLTLMAFAAVLLGFSSASQDIVIDAYRIEIVTKRYQAAMSAMYIAGYRIGMLVSGAGGLYLADFFNKTENYVYSSWQYTYLLMAATMLVGITTTLLIKEPEKTSASNSYLHSTADYLKFFMMFLVMVGSFIFTFNKVVFTTEYTFINQLLRFTSALFVSLSAVYLLVLLKAVNNDMVRQTYIDPVTDFFKRYGKIALLLLLLVGLYRISDIVLGVISNVFYHDLGFTKIEIANTTKVFGIIMTLLGGFLGGVMSMRYGVMRILLLGAILSAATNLLFMILASSGNDIVMLSIVIAADNLSAGIASAAFIAYLSSLTNISFTAVQYAILSSLMTLLPKLLGGYSGTMVNEIGYSDFFMLTAIMGLPVIVLIFYLIKADVISPDER